MTSAFTTTTILTRDYPLLISAQKILVRERDTPEADTPFIDLPVSAADSTVNPPIGALWIFKNHRFLQNTPIEYF